MKILSKILVDSYYELGAADHVPLMMEWEGFDLSSIAVSKSTGVPKISNEPPYKFRTGIFPVEPNEDIFSRVSDSLIDTLEIHNDLEDVLEYYVEIGIQPRWIIGQFFSRKNQIFEELALEGVGIINYKLNDCIMIVPGTVELGFFTIISRKDLDKAYATYMLRNPLEQIRLVKWRNL